MTLLVVWEQSVCIHAAAAAAAKGRQQRTWEEDMKSKNTEEAYRGNMGQTEKDEESSM